MTTTIERIAAILDEDSATSRATIADMERRLSNAYREITELKASRESPDCPRGGCATVGFHAVDECTGPAVEPPAEDDMAAMVDIIADLNKQLDEAHAENARLVLQVAEVEAREEKNIVDMQATIRTLSKQPHSPEPYRINRNLSHPQAGKLLVVRLDRYDVDNLRAEYDVSTTKSQWVGWLEDAHTVPAVEEAKPSTGAPFDEKLPAPVVKTECVFPMCGPACRRSCPDLQTAPVVEEQGPWVIRTAQGRYESRNKWRLARDPDGALQFPTSEAAEQHIASFKPDEWDAHQKPFRVMAVDEARAIEAKKPTGA
jgi:hypothetical protein